jgi:hypothetical protein
MRFLHPLEFLLICNVFVISSLFSPNGLSVKENVHSDTHIRNLEYKLEQSTDKILFLNYEISRESDGSISVKLQDKQVKNGKVKQKLMILNGNEGDDFEIKLLGSNSKSFGRYEIESPLERVVEYVDNAGQLNTKLIVLDSAQFTIRLQADPKIKFIAIQQKSLNAKNTQSLITTQIN